MRPISVTMMGFGTFADAVTVDFEGAEVFALVGPTGSGKSTVIDAICFALYGTIPRYDDRRAVGAAVHALAVEARVSLTFELGGHRYVAVRVVRRDKHGKASTKDARLERVDGEVLAGTAREMDTAVPALLGLNFDQFTRAVVLPQGEFARFLHDKPAQRQDLLVQLLGLDVYERMMQRARVLAAETSAGLARDRERIELLGNVTPELRSSLVAHAVACASARALWRSKKPELDALAGDAAEAEAGAAQAVAHAERLRSVAVPRDLAALAAALVSSERALAKAETEADALAELVLVAETALAVAGARDELIAARDAHASVATLGAESGPVGVARDRAAAQSEVAAAAARAAELHAEELRAASAAQVVREHLVAGEPCPVCEQVVAVVPKGPAPLEWRAARQAAVAAREQAEGAAKALARAEHRAEDLEVRLRAARAAVESSPDAETIAQTLAGLDAAAREAAAVREREQIARRAARRAREERDESSRKAERARDGFRSTRDELSGAGLVPPAESNDIAHDWEALAAWATSESVTNQEAATLATERAESVRSQLRDRREVLTADAVALGLVFDGADAGLDELLEAVAVEERVSRDRVERIDAELAERAALIEAVAARTGDADVATELARLLDANHFERWLVSEALARLVEGGSVRFHDLSNGRYSFAFDDSGRDLLVVDHTQGDERRSVRTLSGGETFQASLALALALSDQLADLAADGAARLESIFLDEGFGTLDAETLDMVATTIENLGVEDRMVGIVTHVPELAQRMPVQFQVTKGARSSHVERRST